jgi:hypothetical protein
MFPWEVWPLIMSGLQFCQSCFKEELTVDPTTTLRAGS